MSIRARLFLFLLCVIVPVVTVFALQKKLIILNGSAFGTTYTAKVYVPIWVTKQRVSQALESEVDRLDAIFSTWNSDSEISQFNANNVDLSIAISADFQLVFTESQFLYQLTSGYFDPTIKPLLDLWGFSSSGQYYKVPDEDKLSALQSQIGMNKLRLEAAVLHKETADIDLEFSSLAKGYAVDRFADIVESFQSNRYMLEIGGEVRVKTARKSQAWTLGIHEPNYQLSFQDLYARVSLTQGCIATSGDYRNYFQENERIYSHIFDPKLAKPVHNNIASVSIIADTCLKADGLATAVMSLGKERGLAIVEALPGVEAMIIYRGETNFQPYVSSNFQSYLVQ